MQTAYLSTSFFWYATNPSMGSQRYPKARLRAEVYAARDEVRSLERDLVALRDVDNAKEASED